MIKVRSLSAVLALGALAALPGCSMFGGGEQPAPVAAAAPAPAPAPAPEASNPQQNAMSRSLVRQVQTALKQDHMYRGKVDGVWGPMTRRGVTQFQQKNNIQATGQLDDATLQAMNIAAPNSGMNSGGMNSGGMNSGSMSNGGMNESGANGTNMPSGAPNDNGAMSAPPAMSGPGTGGTAAPAR